MAFFLEIDRWQISLYLPFANFAQRNIEVCRFIINMADANDIVSYGFWYFKAELTT